MTKELEQLRNESAAKHADESCSNPHNKNPWSWFNADFRTAWNAAIQALTEAAGEFDEKAAQAEADSAMENLGPTMFTRDECAAEMVSHARWQFEQDRVRIGRAEIEIDHLKTSLQIGKDFAEINANRMKAAEARLAEEQKLRMLAGETNFAIAKQRDEIHAKLTAALERCKELEAKLARLEYDISEGQRGSLE